MLTEQQAFELAIATFPDAEFTMDCVDYKGCWAFPMIEKTDISAGRRVFVNKQTKDVMLGDSSFDVKLWNSSPNHKEAIHDVPEIRTIMRNLKKGA